jgi:ABC-type spermidine/putrescine transport system permease subunit I
MRWLHYLIVAVAGIVTGAASLIALAFAGLLATRLIYGDPDSAGWLLVFTWPVWLSLLLGASGLVGIISAMFVHKKLLEGDATPEQR